MGWLNCADCNKQHTYNLDCIKCAARHVCMMFYPAGLSAKAYCAELAKKYGHDVGILINEVRRLRT